MPDLKLKISSESFSEIAGAMEKQGIKFGKDDIKALTVITIEKGTEIEQPYDWPQVYLRRDCMIEAAKVIQYYPDNTILTAIADEIYTWVLNNKSKPEKTGGW